MKQAIVIINLPDNINVEECVIDYQVYHNFQDNVYKEILDKTNVNLRPLPRRLDTQEDVSWYNANKIDGWNDCLDEIVGKNEE